MAVVRVKGYREADRAFRKLSAEVSREFRQEIVKAAEPVAADARSRLSRYRGASLSTIRPIAMARGVVVRQTARKVTGLRGDFGSLQMRRGLIPALDDNTDKVTRELERALDRLTDEAGF